MAGAVWAHDDPQWAGTALRCECYGGAVVVRSLHEIPDALAALVAAREESGEAGGRGHVPVGQGLRGASESQQQWLSRAANKWG